MTAIIRPEAAASISQVLLTPDEVAALFGVHAKTVSRWEDSRVGCVRTPGGHRRYLSAQVYAVRAGKNVPAAALPAGDPDKLLRSGEVALFWRVDIKTVGRWVAAGSLVPAVTTPGGQFRYRETDVLALAGAW